LFRQHPFRRQQIPDFQLAAFDQPDKLLDDRLINSLGINGVNVYYVKLLLILASGQTV
jgi:hypothetical protein